MASFAASTAAYGVGADRGAAGRNISMAPPCSHTVTRPHTPRLNKDRSSSTESSHSNEEKLSKPKKREHKHEPVDECCALTESLDEAGNRIVTLTGTIGRGKRNSQSVQVKLALSENELRRFSTVETQSGEPGPECLWGPRRGFHIFLLTVLFMPLALLSSLCVTFYMGTLTWYNIYLYFSEERTIWHKIFICPLLLLLYPVLIVVISLLISVYATIIQLSWFYQSWIKEIKDFDKGFFAWLCNALHLSQCSPYQVVILDEKVLSRDMHVLQSRDVENHHVTDGDQSETAKMASAQQTSV